MDKIKLHDTADGFLGAAADKAADLSDKAGDFVDKAQQHYDDTAGKVRAMTAEQPLTSLLIAGGVGLMLGVFLARR
jgi:ElaB/YqjD/DUF883 family membrane-anchored ribosome-binding protein